MRAFRGLIVVTACLAGCGPLGPAMPYWVPPGMRAFGTVGHKLETAASQIPEAASMPSFRLELNIPYDRAFSVALMAIKSTGNSVLNADGDRGLIISDQTDHLRSSLVSVYFLQYFVALESIGPQRTVLAFKILQMEQFYADPDDIRPSGLIPTTHFDEVAKRAEAFAQKLRN